MYRLTFVRFTSLIRLYDEASVQALIKAAVNSALKFGQSGETPHTYHTAIVI